MLRSSNLGKYIKLLPRPTPTQNYFIRRRQHHRRLFHTTVPTKIGISSMSSGEQPTRPPISHVLETCLYVKSMAHAVDFYKGKLGLLPYIESDRLSAFALGPTTLLLFQLGKTTKDVVTPRGTIPHHAPTQRILNLLNVDGDEPGDSAGADADEEVKTQSLQQHFCLAVEKKEDVEEWEGYLKAKEVKILSTMDWEKGGRSVYFTDNDGNIGEIGSRGIWDHY